MSDPFLGEIKLLPYNFAPRGWAFCNGQIMAINQSTALFSLLGTTYGGNGTTTFALPDLRGRVPISSGQGPGLSSYVIGEVLGTETSTLNLTNLPAHNHQLQAGTTATTKNPTNSYPGFASSGSAYTDTPTGTMNGAVVGSAGGGQPINNLQPLLVLNWCIALEGIFPSRN